MKMLCDKQLQRCEAMIKDLIVRILLEKIFTLRKLQGRMAAIHLTGIVDNQEMTV